MYLHLNDTKSLGVQNQHMVWLGYGPSTAVLSFWNQASNKFGRCHHARLDDGSFPVKDVTGNALICNNALSCDDKSQTKLVMLEQVDLPFQPHNSFTYQVTIPPPGPLGLVWKNDLDFGLPLIVCMSSSSPFKKIIRQSFNAKYGSL